MILGNKYCVPGFPSVVLEESGDSFILSWASVAGATQYRIYRSYGDEPLQYVESTSQVNFSEYVAGGTYVKYGVSAVNDVACESEKAIKSAQKSTPPNSNEPTYYYYTSDHLNSVRLVIDSQGSIISRFDYEPYGVMLPVTSAADIEESSTRVRFTGQERDSFTGFDNMHFRYYGSNIGRFMKPDNINGNLLNPQSWNLYSYVRGNPVNFNDPTGHEEMQAEPQINKQTNDGNSWSTNPTTEANTVKKLELKLVDMKERKSDSVDEALKLTLDVAGLGITATEKASTPKLSRAALKAAEKWGVEVTNVVTKTIGTGLAIFSAITDSIDVYSDLKNAKPTGTPISKEERKDLIVDAAVGIGLCGLGAALEGPTVGISSILFIPGAAKVGTSLGRLASPMLPAASDQSEPTSQTTINATNEPKQKYYGGFY